MKEKTIRRGDLFYCNFGNNAGSIQCGERPILVLQANDYNNNAPTVVVAAITSVVKKRYLPSHIVLGENFGLKKPSMVLLEQMRTVNKSELQEYIGSIDDERIMRKIDNAMKKTLGLWHYKPVKTENIRCLCGKHLNDYLQDPDYFVERLDRCAKVRERCDKCDNFGWDYIVTEKKHK